MAGKATSFDIAQMAGVSQPTVSRALRGSPMVSEQTRKRIEAIAKQLNYKVDKNASGLRRQESRTLALLLFEDPTPDDSLINPFFLSMLGSITRTCAERGYDLLISFQQLSADWHVDYADTHKADGIILLGYGDYEDYRARLDHLVEQGTRFVRWGSVQEGQPGTTLGSDNRGGGRAATDYLLSLGRQRIAFLGDASSHYPEFEDRYRGHCDALVATDIAVDPQLQQDAVTSEEAGYDAVRKLVRSGTPFDAIFAASDLIAIGALRALSDVGLSVPGSVSVIGFDDIASASLTAPPLTTMMQDARAAGVALVDTLLDSIHGRGGGRALLPTKLVIRKSCAAA
jgi:DNA-binding LacI/PurR family transcriptional regulator